jgi:hypothetical protein
MSLTEPTLATRILERLRKPDFDNRRAADLDVHQVVLGAEVALQLAAEDIDETVRELVANHGIENALVDSKWLRARAKELR